MGRKMQKHSTVVRIEASQNPHKTVTLSLMTVFKIEVAEMA